MLPCYFAFVFVLFFSFFFFFFLFFSCQDHRRAQPIDLSALTIGQSCGALAPSSPPSEESQGSLIAPLSKHNKELGLQFQLLHTLPTPNPPYRASDENQTRTQTEKHESVLKQ